MKFTCLPALWRHAAHSRLHMWQSGGAQEPACSGQVTSTLFSERHNQHLSTRIHLMADLQFKILNVHQPESGQRLCAFSKEGA